jgi:F0F1-type ATP synthase assembly protein I
MDQNLSAACSPEPVWAFFDWLFGTTPWGLFIGVFVGFAAGTLNVVRAAQDLNRDTGPNGSDGADQG